MNIEKLIQETSYILRKYENNTLNYTKLIKILYLADRMAIEEKDFSISGDVYASLPHGPILSGLLDLINDNFFEEEQKKWNSAFKKVDNGSGFYDLQLVDDNVSDDELSKFDKRILDEVDKRFHNYTYGQMIDYVHKNCSEWHDPKIFGSGSNRVSLDYADILMALGRSPESVEVSVLDKQVFDMENHAKAVSFQCR